MLDEELLAALDADEVVQEKGRSAVLRQVLREFLERRKRQAIADAYRCAYSDEATESDPELEAWEQEAVWPED